MDPPDAFGVPAAPNAGRVRGRLLRTDLGPGGQGAVWEIAVAEAEDVETLPNFARAHVGGTMVIYIAPGSRHSLAAGDGVEALVSFQGDERGGAFFLVEDDARKL